MEMLWKQKLSCFNHILATRRIHRLFAEDITGSLWEVDNQEAAEETGTWYRWLGWWGAQYLWKGNIYILPKITKEHTEKTAKMVHIHY